MIKATIKFILLVLLGFISKSPKLRYLVGITLKEISSCFCGLLNMKIEENGSWANQVGYLVKNLSHPIK